MLKPSYAPDEDTASTPAAMISDAEALHQNRGSTGDSGGSPGAVWEAMHQGVTAHERETYRILHASRDRESITSEQFYHNPSDGAFLWMTAIEGSTIPQLNVDQMDWTQHYNFWKEDLRRIRTDLGVKHLRVSPPWYKLNPAPNIYDWGYWDEYVDYAVNALGFELVIDLAHFGTPLWMLRQFADRDFAPRLADYAAAFARRYQGAIRMYCPVNEPYITALFCGDLGCWPPYLKGESNFPPVMANITRGIIEASRAIRAEAPEAALFFVDTTENAWSPDALLDSEVKQRNERRFISFDLAMGKVDHQHPMTEWLLRHNFREEDLCYFQENPAPVDIIGLDYYPQSEAILRVTSPSGDYRQMDMMGARRMHKLYDPAHTDPAEREWPIGFYGVAKAYQERYNKPIMLAETNWCGGPIEHRLQWMNLMLSDCRRLRAEGFPLIGFCWWGAYDHMDWGLALRLHSGKIHPVGLWNLRRKNWVLVREPSPLLTRYRKVIHNTEAEVGSFPLRADTVLNMPQASEGLSRRHPPARGGADRIEAK